ncbi:hypothetical protein T492DRAFT_893365 [Pavlovales sp. CCMP2436]|nr:hypothetical protein T492DRAFT_893365 [Pavlovales sp. CCMP2436]
MARRYPALGGDRLPPALAWLFGYLEHAHVHVDDVLGAANRVPPLTVSALLDAIEMAGEPKALANPEMVAAALKVYIEGLPEPLVRHEQYRALLVAASEGDPRARVDALMRVVDALPDAHRECLHRLCDLLVQLGGKTPGTQALAELVRDWSDAIVPARPSGPVGREFGERMRERLHFHALGALAQHSAAVFQNAPLRAAQPELRMPVASRAPLAPDPRYAPPPAARSGGGDYGGGSGGGGRAGYDRSPPPPSRAPPPQSSTPGGFGGGGFGGESGPLGPSAPSRSQTIDGSLLRDAEGRFKLLIKEDAQGGVYIDKLQESSATDDRQRFCVGDTVTKLDGLSVGLNRGGMSVEGAKERIKNASSLVKLTVYRPRSAAGDGGGLGGLGGLEAPRVPVAPPAGRGPRGRGLAGSSNSGGGGMGFDLLGGLLDTPPAPMGAPPPPPPGAGGLGDVGFVPLSALGGALPMDLFCATLSGGSAAGDGAGGGAPTSRSRDGGFDVSPRSNSNHSGRHEERREGRREERRDGPSRPRSPAHSPAVSDRSGGGGGGGGRPFSSLSRHPWELEPELPAAAEGREGYGASAAPSAPLASFGARGGGFGGFGVDAGDGFMTEATGPSAFAEERRGGGGGSFPPEPVSTSFSGPSSGSAGASELGSRSEHSLPPALAKQPSTPRQPMSPPPPPNESAAELASRLAREAEEEAAKAQEMANKLAARAAARARDEETARVIQ